MLNFRFREKTNTWPGFVDLFSNLVIILIFLLIVFVFLWTTTSVFNKSSGLKTVSELKKTTEEQALSIAQMSADEQEAKRLLVMARSELEVLQQAKTELENKTTELQTKAADLQTKATNLQTKTTDLENEKADLQDKISALNNQLQQKDSDIQELVNSYEGKVSNMQDSEAKLQDMIGQLNNQLNQAVVDKQKTAELEQQRRALQSDLEAQRLALSDQLSKLQSSLDAAEAKSQSQEVQYTELSNRLNKALADKVAELSKVGQYQSDFYKAIKLALGDRTTIKQEGDRFIISSDILFSSGEYNLSPEGKNQLRLIANVIKDMENKIPTDVNWIVRVDGHTDKTPVNPGNKVFKNNTQLSLLRAIAVSGELEKAGVSKRRLVPSGFGEMYPVELGTDASSLQKNRRIELRLTNR